MTYPTSLQGYIAFYNGNRLEFYVHSLSAAKAKAIAYFNAPKSKQGLISVHLADKETA